MTVKKAKPKKVVECIASPHGKHVVDPDCDYGWVKYCKWCSEEMA